MTIVQMLGQSGILTVLGMGVVFGFLIIMIITISLVGKVITAAEAKKAVVTAATPVEANTAGGTPVAPGNDAYVTAAISAAVSQYRKAN
jgi:oxaloacetate decarboxylase gamma subunit